MTMSSTVNWSRIFSAVTCVACIVITALVYPQKSTIFWIGEGVILWLTAISLLLVVRIASDGVFKTNCVSHNSPQNSWRASSAMKILGPIAVIILLATVIWMLKDVRVAADDEDDEGESLPVLPANLR